MRRHIGWKPYRKESFVEQPQFQLDEAQRAVYDRDDVLIATANPYRGLEPCREMVKRANAYPDLIAEIERLQIALNERDQARACTRWLVEKYRTTD